MRGGAGVYAQAPGGKVTGLMRYQGSPMAGERTPPGWGRKVMHATFKAADTEFMASDGMPGMPAPIYGGFAMCVYLPKGKEQAGRVFLALADGSKVTMPFAPPLWSGHFGMLVDCFSVPWMVSCG